MKEFRSLEEVTTASLPVPLARAVHTALQRLMDAYADCGQFYVPEQAGHVVLVEARDTDEPLRRNLGGFTLQDALFEGAAYAHGCFLTCILFNNEFGLSIVVPDEPWLDPAVRDRLAEDL